MTDTTSRHSPDQTLGALAEAFWRQYLADHPTFATTIAEPGHDDRLEDPSPEARAAQRSRLLQLRRSVAALDPASLSTTDRITHAALLDELRNGIAIIDTGLERWTVDPLEGIPVGLLNLVQVQPLETVEQGEAMVERWRAIGPFVDASTANLRAANAEGVTAARSAIDRVVDMLDELLASPDEEWPLLEPLEARRDGWPATAIASFEDDLRGAVATVVRPALERYRGALVDTIRPDARSDERVGIGVLPAGDDAYAALVRVHTSLDVSAAELHETGLQEVDRIRRELAELGRQVLGADGVAATIERLRDDASLRFSTSAEVRSTAEASLDRARGAIGGFFGRLPHAECVVVPIPAHEAEHSTLAYYLWPAADGSRPGRYYINLSHPETRPRYEAEALAFHESIPGHHLQIAIGQELEGIPAFRRHLGSTAFFEGWGLYTERLAEEMGLYSADLDRFGVLSFDAWRACRLVVDTGMHVMGWSRQQAIAYMTENTALAANNIVNEVDRYIVWPGQAVAYKTGQLELLGLRADAHRTLGSRFDIRAFHDAALGNGAVPLPVLRTVIEEWATEGAA